MACNYGSVTNQIDWTKSFIQIYLDCCELLKW